MSEKIVGGRVEAQYRLRKGTPLPGCDCMQCFGYCIINADIRDREVRASIEAARSTRNAGDPRELDFEAD